MKKFILLIVLLSAAGIAIAVPMRSHHRTIWIVFKDEGKYWMVGALPEFASCSTDPEYVQAPELDAENSVEVQSYGETLAFNNCCTTNILIKTNFTGTIQVGSRIYTVKELEGAK